MHFAFNLSTALEAWQVSAICPNLGIARKLAIVVPARGRLRATYLQRIAALLDGRTRTISHADVKRACAQAQAHVLQSHVCCPAQGEDDAA